MTDSSGNRRDESDGSPRPFKKDTKNVPPLVWIVLVLLVVLAVVAVAKWRSTTHSPNGAAAPAVSDGNVIPPPSSTPGVPETVTSG